jgi:UDP-glucose 4-epimerase
VCALRNDVPFSSYNVARGIKTSIRELTELILRITGSALPIQFEPDSQTFVTNRVGDPVAAERDLGFKWSVDLENGLRRLIEWRKSHEEQMERSIDS